MTLGLESSDCESFPSSYISFTFRAINIKHSGELSSAERFPLAKDGNYCNDRWCAMTDLMMRVKHNKLFNFNMSPMMLRALKLISRIFHLVAFFIKVGLNDNQASPA